MTQIDRNELERVAGGKSAARGKVPASTGKLGAVGRGIGGKLGWAGAIYDGAKFMGEAIRDADRKAVASGRHLQGPLGNWENKRAPYPTPVHHLK